jgi:hypothetical protein
MNELRRFEGRCHCGNLSIAFETTIDPGALPVRECACTFCRRHGARSIADRNGWASVRAERVDLVSRYDFGLHTAEFWICSRCGVYVAAVMREPGRIYATINVRCLDDAAAFTSPPVTMNYDQDDATQRRARRREQWTPVRELSV